MSYDYHVLLGALSAGLALVAYATYFRSIFRGDTKPHLFTWLIFGVVDGVVFWIQVGDGGGPGSWILGVAAVMNTLVAISALRYGERNIRIIDWICLGGASLGITLWLLADDPLSAVVFFVITGTFAVAPTFRKSYRKPHEESVSIWAIDVVRFALSIVALESQTLVTVLFPLAVVVQNAALVAFLLIRRRQLGTLS
ncbi:MAG: hypothetical protein HYS26_04025 [Candidatus Kaiserbacteria bacterium]|nr:MAG: hypothetical protein HYS26_04025 [Candidatus Kaiserbacteria bacterium]